MGRSGWSLSSVVMAALTIAPWAVYVAGIAMITDGINGGLLNFTWLKQATIMLEWFTVWYEFAIIILALVFALAGHLKGSAYWLNGFLAINTALIIQRATVRITQATQLHDNEVVAELSFDNAYTAAALTAAGQVSTAGFNFLLMIVLGHAGGHDAVQHKSATPPHAA